MRFQVYIHTCSNLHIYPCDSMWLQCPAIGQSPQDSWHHSIMNTEPSSPTGRHWPPLGLQVHKSSAEFKESRTKNFLWLKAFLQSATLKLRMTWTRCSLITKYGIQSVDQNLLCGGSSRVTSYFAVQGTFWDPVFESEMPIEVRPLAGFELPWWF